MPQLTGSFLLFPSSPLAGESFTLDGIHRTPLGACPPCGRSDFFAGIALQCRHEERAAPVNGSSKALPISGQSRRSQTILPFFGWLALAIKSPTVRSPPFSASELRPAITHVVHEEE